MKLHDFKLAIAVTGGGSLFISDRLTEGGASSYLLDAQVPYAQKALEAYVGGTVREKFCSASTARQMALAAHAKGLALSETKRVIGVGVTCSLTRPEGEREGREHAMHIALISAHHVVEVNWNDTKAVPFIKDMSRAEQERFVADLIKNSIERFADGVSRMTHKGEVTFEDLFSALNMPQWGLSLKFPDSFSSEAVRSLNYSAKGVHHFGIRAFEDFYATHETICVYPGSFNPWHEGHQEVYDKSVELFGGKATFLEISATNFDKPGLDAIELGNRLKELSGKNVLVTDAPTFIRKYINLKGKYNIVFAVGADTFERINFDDFADVEFGKIKFLVFPRNGRTVRDFNVKPWFIHEASYDLTEGPRISSTELRKNRK